MPQLKSFSTIRISVHVYAVLSMIFWGLSYLWSKIAFEYIGPASTIFFRLAISSVLLVFILLVLGKIPKFSINDLKLLLLSALFNPFLYFIGESFGLQLVSSTISAVIIATIPVFMPVVAYFFLKERLKPINLIGLAISFTGVLVMIVDRTFSLTASPIGIALLFGAVAAALVYGLLLKKLTLKFSPLTIIALQNTIGVFYFLPLVLFLESGDIFNIPLEMRLIVTLLLLGIFASSIAYIFYTKVVQKIGISKANIYTNLIPVFTALFSFLWLGEHISIDKMIGILLVVGGVVLSQRKETKK